MKTIFTLVASLFFSVALFAADAKPKSTLTIRSTSFGDVKVMLDGKRFESSTNTVTIQDLVSGYHTIKVYQPKSSGMFSIFAKRYDEVYNTALNIKPGTAVSITIDRLGRASISEAKIFRGRGRGWDDRDNDEVYVYKDGGSWGDYDNNYGYTSSMSDREFSQLLNDINKEWLETNKLKSATQVVKTTELTSAQVKQLVLLFSFENNKLELAKQAYANTVDKKNYFMLNDVFAFNSSKDELARYIRSCQ